MNPPHRKTSCGATASAGARTISSTGEHERHADVFPDAEAVATAGYTDQTESDLLSVLNESPLVGIPANEIPHLKKRQGSETFGSLQEALDAKLAEKKIRAAGRAFHLAS
ncbi:hypothetical protein [Streptomyces sp. NPDC046985]|uniref:GP88 family protein n=1 Tax=Streptomyces sp. NPDC046985 TaxID=3155377 RepID=UPI0033E1A3F2